jgi:biotin synthase-like enzyme
VFEAYARLAERALRDEPPDEKEALWILDGEDVSLLPLLQAAFAPRERHFDRQVMVHVLNNVQNGLCPEDCGYCSQSRDSKASPRPRRRPAPERAATAWCSRGAVPRSPPPGAWPR